MTISEPCSPRITTAEVLRQLGDQVRLHGSVSFRAEGQLYICVPATSVVRPFMPAGGGPEDMAAVRLTERQRQILRMIDAGHSTVEVADLLDVAVNTVAQHLVIVRRKYGVTRTGDAINLAKANGQLEP